MRILIISNTFPWPLDRAIPQRVHYLTEALAKEHQVTLVSLARDDDDTAGTPLRGVCEDVITIPDHSSHWGPKLWSPIAEQTLSLLTAGQPPSVARDQNSHLTDRLRQLRGERHFDLVWAQRAPLAECARSAGFDRIVVDMADLDWQAIARAAQNSGWYVRKPLHRLEISRLRRYERSLASRFAGVTVCTEADRMFFGDDRDRVMVVPNGTAGIVPMDADDEVRGELLFVGTLGYEPNIDACEYFTKEVLPLLRELEPGARLTIVGRGAGPGIRALNDGVSCTVVSPAADLAPFYRRASVVIAPIRLGAGTRLKILEALARNKAVVSTTFGADGLDLAPNRDLLIADTPRAFAEACARLLSDPKLRQNVGANGASRVRERFTWDAIGKLAERGLSTLVRDAVFTREAAQAAAR